MVSLEKIGKFKVSCFSDNEWEDKRKKPNPFQHSNKNFLPLSENQLQQNSSLFFQKTFTQIPQQNTFTFQIHLK